jgi:hypothetical protein
MVESLDKTAAANEVLDLEERFAGLDPDEQFTGFKYYLEERSTGLDPDTRRSNSSQTSTRYTTLQLNVLTR